MLPVSLGKALKGSQGLSAHSVGQTSVWMWMWMCVVCGSQPGCNQSCWREEGKRLKNRACERCAENRFPKILTGLASVRTPFTDCREYAFKRLF